MHISYLQPVARAWDGMVQTLFKPFSMGTWFVLGFSAWLAAIGEGGGFNFNMPSFDEGDWGKGEGQVVLAGIADFVRDHIVLVVVLALVVVMVGLALGLLFMWLRARGGFMFMDNLARGRAEVNRPWKEYAGEGNSAFLWQLVFALVTGGVFLVVAVIAGLVCLPSYWADTMLTGSIIGLVLVGLLALALALAAGFIGMYMNQFVAPIMYLRRCRAMAAWREFLVLMRAHPARFVGYGFFYVALYAAVILAFILALVFTCCFCCLGLLLFLPYLNTVIILPIPVFLRLYGLNFLAQFGAEYDVFHAPAPSGSAGDLPPAAAVEVPVT